MTATMKLLDAERAPLSYHLRNARAHVRAWRVVPAKLLALPRIESTLRAVLVNPDGSRVDYGIVSRRVVTTAGVNYVAGCFTNTNEPESMNFHASGTGTGAEAVGDTALGTQQGSRVSGTQSNPSGNVYRTVATIGYTSTLAITEHGVFSASTGGTLLDRSVFSAINVVNGSSIEFTYELTIAAGG